VQWLPDPIKTDANNFAPRVGLAWSPGDRRTVLRAGFGIYFDRIRLRATSNALQRDGSKYVVVQLAPGQTAAPVFPNVLPAQPSTLLTKPNKTPKSAKRTAEKINKIDGFIQSSANADLSQCLGPAPSAEALGYSQPSASPTFEAKPARWIR